MPLVPISAPSKAGRPGLRGELFHFTLPDSSYLLYASQRENLLRQIREKNETISILLHQLRNSSIATPISINAARLALKPTEREMHGEVLSWMERRHAVSTQSSEKACVAYDTSQLEDDDMYSSSDDDDENDEDGSSALVPSASASHGPPISALPEDIAPLGFLASVSTHWNNSSPNFLGTDLFGIANKRYFQPSESRIVFFHTGVLLQDPLRSVYRFESSANSYRA